MSGDTKLTELINGASSVLESLVEQCASTEPSQAFEHLLNPTIGDNDMREDSSFDKLEDVISLESLDYKISVPEDVDESETESITKEVESHNEQIEQRLKDFIYLRSCSDVADRYLEKFVEKCKALGDTKDTVIDVKNIKVHKEFQDEYNELSVLLDLIIDFTNYNASFKKVFYQVVSTISQILLNIETKYLELFWYYMETRIDLIQSKVFNKDVTGDRISILEICNPLTDKYYQKDYYGVNTYKKDTFNDVIQARIRLLINRLFNMEDNTGLNRYFSTSNRRIPETSLSRKRDNFVIDILECFKAMRDPYSYLKQNKLRQLRETSNTFFKVLDKLLPMELDHVNNTKIDKYAKRKPAVGPQAEYLQKKYNEKLYFPELYWVSVFNKNRATVEKEVNDDQDFFHDLFDDAEYRQIFLIQLYLVSSFFYEMSSGLKKDLLKGYPPNVKHIIDDSTNEVVAKKFFALKRKMLKELRDVDPTYSFLLQQVDTVERQWWQWLLYGRDLKTKEPLLSDKTLPKETLLEVETNFNSLFPIKEKRYFNVYATPQLSRRMKGTRGLENIQIKRSDDLNGNDENSMDYEESNGELKNIRVWKQFRQKRQHQWLDFGDILDDSIVSGTKDEPSESEEPEKEIEEPEKEIEEPDKEIEEPEKETDEAEKYPESTNDNEDDQPATKKAKLENEDQENDQTMKPEDES